MTRRILLIVAVLLSTAAPLFARRFILQTSGSTVLDVAAQHGLTIVNQIPDSDLFLVTAPDEVDVNQLISEVSSDSNVVSFEIDNVAATPEASSAVIEPTISSSS